MDLTKAGLHFYPKKFYWMEWSWDICTVSYVAMKIGYEDYLAMKIGVLGKFVEQWMNQWMNLLSDMNREVNWDEGLEKVNGTFREPKINANDAWYLLRKYVYFEYNI